MSKKIDKDDIMDTITKAGILNDIKIRPLEPDLLDVTCLTDKEHRFITSTSSTSPYTITQNPWSVTLEGYDYTNTRDSITYKLKTPKTFNIGVITDANKTNKSIVGALYDKDPTDLCTEHILTMVETMKAKLMCTVHDLRINHFECKMTPEVRKIITRAWKKIEMYGKLPPFIPRFDEYLNELPEKFNVAGGLLVKMVEPEDYGELYFEIDAVQGDKWTIVNDLSNSDGTVTRRLADRPTPLWDPDELLF